MLPTRSQCNLNTRKCHLKDISYDNNEAYTKIKCLYLFGKVWVKITIHASEELTKINWEIRVYTKMYT